MRTKKTGSVRLYHGTSEAIAKISPNKGIEPYSLPPTEFGVQRSFRASNQKSVCLTSIYPGLMSFDTAHYKERWGLIEIDPRHLDQSLFSPHEIYLAERSKKRFSTENEYLSAIQDYRLKIDTSQRLWRPSFDDLGLCWYSGTIPVKAITKVTIYDPMSNWMVTKDMLRAGIGCRQHKLQKNRHKMLTRWYAAEYIDPDEWIGGGFSNLPQKERETILRGLQNKMGLDIFYSVTVKDEKPTWWKQ